MAAAATLSNLLSSLTLNTTTTTKPKIINLRCNNDRPEFCPLISYPSLSHANIMHFKSAYNVQIIVEENEHEEELIRRFRRQVLRARILQECKRRRFFENPQDKAKRKTRDAKRRYRKGPLKSKDFDQDSKKDYKMKRDEDDGDNWEVVDEGPVHDYLLHLSQTSNRWNNDERRSTSNTHSDNTTFPLVGSEKKKKGKWNK